MADCQQMSSLEKQVKSCYKNTQNPGLERNQRIQEYLGKLSTTPETNYSLWEATKRLKRPQTHHPPIRK